MPSNVPKKQHYVPQRALLSRFTGADGKLFVLDKKNGESRPSKTNEVAHEKYFYRYTDDDGRPQCIESHLAQFDGEVAPLIAKICETGEFFWVNPTEWRVIERFVIVQLLRSPRAKSRLKDTASRLQTVAAALPVDSDVGFLAKTTQEESAATAFEMITQCLPHFEGALGGKKKILLTPEVRSENFYMSDHPVVLFNQHGNQGLQCPGIELYLPLSPKLVLGFLCPQVFAARRFSYKKAVRLGRAVGVSQADVDFLNELQVRNSTRFIFSDSADFDIAGRLLDAEPSLRDPPLPRLLNKMVESAL